MGLRIGERRLASIIAVAGAVSLLSAPVGLHAAGGQQPGAAQERQQYPAAGQEQHQPQQEQFQAQEQFKAEHEGLAQQLSQEEIRQVQQKLSEMGHDPGPVNGVWGPQTQAAVKEFQQKKDIEATGQLDQRTLSELGVEATAIEQPGVQQQPGVQEQPGMQQRQPGAPEQPISPQQEGTFGTQPGR